LVDGLSFAFQPVVNSHTGACYGVETFVRGLESTPFSDAASLLDAAEGEGVIALVEAAMHIKASGLFRRIPGYSGLKLFLNSDIRAMRDAEDICLRLSSGMGLSMETLVLEISEGRRLGGSDGDLDTIRGLKENCIRLTLDDFGVGHSSLEQLYFTEPDFIKVNRFFIAGLAHDPKKKLFLSHIVMIAHLLGITVIAEGVETEAEFWICRELGCDLVQGYLIQHPTEDPEDIRTRYDEISDLAKRERRRAMAWDQRIVHDEMLRMEPLPMDAGMLSVFEVFRTHKALSFYPVVDSMGEPMGIVRDRDLKEFAYSIYGIERIVSSGMGRTLSRMVVRCPVADVNTKADAILRIFSANPNAECILLVNHRRYVGFLAAQSLLRIMNEKTLAAAKDQNPLTNLPGNNRIHDRISEILALCDQPFTLVWLDFDNFKPFNDKYGFRQGDRALLLFAELMTKEAFPFGAFIGHIGGDDFFLAWPGDCLDSVLGAVDRMRTKFAEDVLTFYDDADRQAGYLQAEDRHGELRRFPMLDCSAAVLHLEAGRPSLGMDAVVGTIADVKKAAKAGTERVAIQSVTRSGT
jgi:diguanylate cyclase (GGDEF)-like protein